MGKNQKRKDSPLDETSQIQTIKLNQSPPQKIIHSTMVTLNGKNKSWSINRLETYCHQKITQKPKQKIKHDSHRPLHLKSRPPLLQQKHPLPKQKFPLHKQKQNPLNLKKSKNPINCQQMISPPKYIFMIIKSFRKQL